MDGKYRVCQWMPQTDDTRERSDIQQCDCEEMATNPALSHDKLLWPSFSSVLPSQQHWRTGCDREASWTPVSRGTSPSLWVTRKWRLAAVGHRCVPRHKIVKYLWRRPCYFLLKYQFRVNEGISWSDYFPRHRKRWILEDSNLPVRQWNICFIIDKK